MNENEIKISAFMTASGINLSKFHRTLDTTYEA